MSSIAHTAGPQAERRRAIRDLRHRRDISRDPHATAWTTAETRIRFLPLDAALDVQSDMEERGELPPVDGARAVAKIRKVAPELAARMPVQRPPLPRRRAARRPMVFRPSAGRRARPRRAERPAPRSTAPPDDPAPPRPLAPRDAAGVWT